MSVECKWNENRHKKTRFPWEQYIVLEKLQSEFLARTFNHTRSLFFSSFVFFFKSSFLVWRTFQKMIRWLLLLLLPLTVTFFQSNLLSAFSGCCFFEIVLTVFFSNFPTLFSMLHFLFLRATEAHTQTERQWRVSNF